MGVTRNVALSELPIRGLSINTATDAYELVPSDSGIMFINTYATLTTYTLPAVADGAGKIFFFLQAATDAYSTMIAAQTACIKGLAATLKTSCRAAGRGSFALVVGDGTYYYVFSVGFSTLA